MLRITSSESSAAAKSYFGRSLSRGDYYLEGHEVAGAWGGKGAARLGLTGPMAREDFLGLLDNLRPDGTRLTARTVLNRRPGYDFTFDVPKSVSILHALTQDERIVHAMHEAVVETMGEMEAEMHARVRKAGAFHDRKTAEMIWADFTHFTSRPAPLSEDAWSRLQASDPVHAERLKREAGRDRNATGPTVPDPHLHVHVYVINATYDAVEGQWKAGEFMRMKRDASYYQAAYHVRLAGELQKLGFEIEPTAKAFEIAGVPREMVELFSRRTKEVEEAARELGIEDAERKAELGARTRRGKESSLSVEELRRIWRGFLRADEAPRLSEIAGLARTFGRGVAIDNLPLAHKGVKYALGRELERVSVVSEKRLLASALMHAVGNASVETVRQALGERPEVIDAEIGGERCLSTREVLAEESRLMGWIRKSRGCVPPIVFGEVAFRTDLLARESTANAEQRAAVRHVLNSQDWISGVIGRAGTGKTAMLQEIDASVWAAGRRMVVCAPTAEASRGVLRGEGFIAADTVKRLLTDEALHAQLRGNVLWVDEAGMLGNRDMLALLELAKRNGAVRVVLAGDPSQIRSVPRGDALRFLEENAGLSVARLETIRRQKNPELKEAVEALSQGDAERGLSILEKQGAVIEAETKEAHAQLAECYVKRAAERFVNGTPKSVLVVSPTHREGEQITEAIRSRLKETGDLGRADKKVTRTVNLSWTEAEKKNPAAYEPGLVIQFKQHAPGFRRGERVRVTDVDGRKGVVTVEKLEGASATLPLSKPERFHVYRETEIKVACGERLRVTESVRMGQERWNAGDTVKLDGFTPQGDLALTNGKVLPKDFGHLAHGYVVTADSAQSKTVDTVLAAIGSESMSATDLRRMYVTVSRARTEVRIYTDDKERLREAAARDSERHSATELDAVRQNKALLQRIVRDEIEREDAARRRHFERQRAVEKAANPPEIEVEHG